jgi:hypothetical protein
MDGMRHPHAFRPDRVPVDKTGQKGEKGGIEHNRSKGCRCPQGHGVRSGRMSGFKVQRRTIELAGLCPTCRGAENE